MRRSLKGGQFYGTALKKRSVSGLLLVDSFHPAGTRLPRHAHERAYFCVNRGGEYVEHYGRRTRTCQEGMVTFHPAGEVHWEVHKASPVRSLNVEFTPEWLKRVLDYAGPLDQPAEFRGDAVAASTLQLAREFDEADEDSDAAIESLALEILGAATCVRVAATGTPRWLADALDLLDGHLHERLTLGSLA